MGAGDRDVEVEEMNRAHSSSLEKSYAVERVMPVRRVQGLQAAHRRGNRHGPRADDGAIAVEVPDEMWVREPTTEEGTAALFVAVGHCTTECVGIHAANRGNRFGALEPILGIKSSPARVRHDVLEEAA